MSKVAIFVSDLHLGIGDELEDFSEENETAFVRFLKDHSAKYRGQDVDLVILGDFLDIWQVATDDEKRAEESTSITINIYFVRFFWNRIEPEEPDVDIWWNIFRVIWERRLWSLLRKAFNFFRQYRSDPRDFKGIDLPGVPYFDARLGPVPPPVTGKSLPEFPEILLSDKRDPERIFSTDLPTENRLRAFYHDPDNAEFRVEVDQILSEKFQGQAPPVPSRLLPPAPEFGLLVDDCVTAVAEMFADPGESPRC